MKKTFSKKPGYILFLTISVLAIITTIVTQIYYVGSAYNLFIPLTFEKAKARQLALSGISIASTQLLLQDKHLQSGKKEIKESDDDKKNKNNPEKKQKELLKTLLLVQNQWQEFNLTTEKDGLDAVIKICITCEEGKINLNRIFNKKKKEFNSIDKGVSSEVFFKVVTDRMKEFFKDIDVTTLMLTDIKKQKNPYATVMELLKNKNFNFFVDTAYFMPPNQHSGNAQTENSNQKIYLTDIFTTLTNDLKINPWVLSSSLQALLGLKKIKQLKKEDIDSMLEKISLSSIKWEQQWDSSLKDIYGKEFKALPKEIIPYLSTKFEPRAFSVVCYAKVGRIEQKLIAILRRTANESSDKITVKKIYWL